MTEMQTREWHRWYQRMSNVEKRRSLFPLDPKEKWADWELARAPRHEVT